jgi:hypothetical protein
MPSPRDEHWRGACDLRSPVDALSLWAALRDATVVVVRIGAEPGLWYIKETPASSRKMLSIVAANHWQLLLLNLLAHVDRWLPGLQESLIELRKPAWQEDAEARALMFRMAADSGAT